MKTQTDVMTLAWKIHKSNLNLVNFYYALKLSWKIVKQVKVEITKSVINFYSKSLTKIKLYTEHTKSNNIITINNNTYDFNMIISELKMLLS